MEPTNNLNNFSSADNNPNNQNRVPSPGPHFGTTSFQKNEPLASTPRVSFTSVMNDSSKKDINPSASISSAPSALDRLMNPTLNTAKSTPPTNISQPTTSSTFKPYVPPSTSTPSAASVSTAPASQTSAYSAPSVTASSSAAPSPSSESNLGYKVGSPLSYQSPQKPIPESQFSRPTSSVVPPAPSAALTSQALNQEIHSILNGSQPTPLKKSHMTLVWSILGLIVLGGLGYGGYYWYTNMYMKPSLVQNTPVDQGTSSASKPSQNTSSFPTAVTNTVSKPNVATSSKTTARPDSSTFAPAVATSSSKQTTTPKVTKVTTPLSQAQRQMVSSYIINNINKIAPIKSRTTYVVEDITFDGPDRAVVQYSDSRGTYAAIATVSIDTAGTVKVVNFVNLEK